MANNIISLDAAKAQGLKFYFTGIPCGKGHIAKRSVAKRDCCSCKRENEKRRQKENREHCRSVNAAWREKKKDILNADVRVRYAKNPDAFKARSQKWKDSNPDRARVISRAKSSRWRANNRQKSKEVHEISRARRNAIRKCSSYTADDVSEIMKLQRNKCGYCRVSLKGKYHVDHIIAVSKGGSNARSNVQVLCPSCNLSKHAKDPIDFAQSRGMLI